MKKSFLIKIFIIVIAILIGLTGFSYSYKPSTKSLNLSGTPEIPGKTPEKILDAAKDIAGYKNWTKINNKPYFVESRLAMQCIRPSRIEIDAEAKNPHNDKFINVYVNDIGKDEMLTKKKPLFPAGTVIVKEKLTTVESTAPELLTVMIKREKGYNPEVGDWEFLTFNGSGTETTARGKLENCQTCHLVEKSTDYISRRYLPF